MDEPSPSALNLKLETILPDLSQLGNLGAPEGLSALVVVTLLALFGCSLIFALREFWLSLSRVSELQGLLSGADRQTLAERLNVLLRSKTDLSSAVVTTDIVSEDAMLNIFQ